MSDISRRELSRRQFLKSGLALAAGVATLGPQQALGNEQDDYTRWAFLSDTHIAIDPDNRFRGFYPYRNLQEVAGQIAYDMPDGVVITGDLARLRGHTGAYENLKAVLAPVAAQRPVYLGLGNHDNRRDFFQAFRHTGDVAGAVENKHIITTNTGPIRLVVLDTLLVVDTLPGLLGRWQRTWLDAFLHVCDDTPTILFLHHTPKAHLLDTGRFFDIIRPATKVKAVIYGHSHRYGFSESDGIHFINLPATGYNFRGSQPVGWMEARMTRRGGEFFLHAIGGNRRPDRQVVKLRWRA